MKTLEDKAEMRRQQLISKIRWGAQQQEVSEWLEEKHGIVGSEADQLIAEGFRAKRSAVRGHALIRLVLSILGIALVGAFFYIRFFCGVIFYGTGAIFATIFAFGIGSFSLATFARSLKHLLTGETLGSVD